MLGLEASVDRDVARNTWSVEIRKCIPNETLVVVYYPGEKNATILQCSLVKLSVDCFCLFVRMDRRKLIIVVDN